MNFDFTEFLIKVLLLAPPILIALTVHEVSHGVVALRFGDPTAKMAGRLTLNPLKHLDPAGTIVFFVTAFLGSGFGWAKPVPVNPRYFKNPRKDMMWVSAAGPIANILCATACAFVLKGVVALGLHQGMAGAFLGQMFAYGVFINVILAVFNLIPVPPLDGSGILAGLLPEDRGRLRVTSKSLTPLRLRDTFGYADFYQCAWTTVYLPCHKVPGRIIVPGRFVLTDRKAYNRSSRTMTSDRQAGNIRGATGFAPPPDPQE